jgi:hypothetical protein
VGLKIDDVDLRRRSKRPNARDSERGSVGEDERLKIVTRLD